MRKIDKNNWYVEIDESNRDIIREFFDNNQYFYSIGMYYGLKDGKIKTTCPKVKNKADWLPEQELTLEELKNITSTKYNTENINNYEIF